MTAQGQRGRQIVSSTSRPLLAKHVKLQHNKVRDQWVLLAPERLLEPDEPALETIRRCDGEATVDEIAQSLANEYNASAEDIKRDVLPLLQDLTDKRFMTIKQDHD